MRNGPELWTAILAQMPAGAVIAGGAVRDYLLGIEPKDIDVFMGMPPVVEIEPEPVSDLFVLGDLLSADPRSGLYRIEDRHERQQEYAAVSNIDLVSSGTLLGHRVDAIVLTDFSGGDALVEGFDFGITRCWYSADSGLHDSPQAARDRSHNVVSLYLGDRRQRAEQRFARFNERMGGRFTLIDRTP